MASPAAMRELRPVAGGPNSSGADALDHRSNLRKWMQITRKAALLWGRGKPSFRAVLMKSSEYEVSCFSRLGNLSFSEAVTA